MTTNNKKFVPVSYQARHFAMGEWQKWFEITKSQYDKISSMGTTLAEARPLYSAETVAHLQARVDELEETMKLVQRMNKEALPNFNWGASCLDANSIQLLNQAQIAVDATLQPKES